MTHDGIFWGLGLHPQVPTRSLHARNGLRPRKSGGTSHSGAVYVAFTTTDRLGLCNFGDFVAQSHSSHDRCVRFSPAVTGRTCNTRYRAARYALPGRDFHPLDRASFAWRTHCHRTPSSIRLTYRALILQQPASDTCPSLTQRAPEIALDCASGRTSLRVATDNMTGFLTPGSSRKRARSRAAMAQARKGSFPCPCQDRRQLQSAWAQPR